MAPLLGTRWLRQNSGLRADKAPGPVFPALGLRFETGLLLLTFLTEIGGELRVLTERIKAREEPQVV